MIDYLTAISEMYQGKVVQYVGTVNGNVFVEDGAKLCMTRGVVFDYPVQKVARVPLYDPDFRYRLTGETVDTTIWPIMDTQKEHIMPESEQLQAANTELEEALDYVESLNKMWHWRSIHRNDESEFRHVQAFLSKHGRSTQSCEF